MRLALSELGAFRNGVNFANGLKGRGLGLINVKDIFRDSPKVDFGSLDLVNLADVRGIERYFVEEGDLFFVRSSVKRDGIGFVAYSDERHHGAVHCGFVIRFRPDKAKIDYRFLTYALRSANARERIRNLSGGATITNISQEALRTLELDIPPLPIQQRIASILSAYDDLIENNERRVRILESMARAIYREWFVHFRFPGHANQPRVVSPLGEIPKGWAVRKLGDALQLQYGKALKKGDRRDGAVPVYGSSGIIGFHDTSLAKGPGIIVGRKGNVGSVFWSDDDFFVIDTAYFVTSTLPLRFLYYVLPTLNFINSDAAVPGLSRSQAYALDILVPPQPLLASFCTLVDTFELQATTLQRQTQILRRSRDLLLPRLLSGEVEVEAA